MISNERPLEYKWFFIPRLHKLNLSAIPQGVIELDTSILFLSDDHSRVKLSQAQDDEEGSDYINANYVPVWKATYVYTFIDILFQHISTHLKLHLTIT